MTISTPLHVTYNVDALREQQFPVTRDTVYLNHAGISPLPRRTYEAMRDMDERMMRQPADAGAFYFEHDKVFRETLRALINAEDAEEIVGVQSTSLGFNLVAQALDWKPGQNIVLCDVEFPSNAYPWLRLQEQHHIEARLVPNTDGGLTLDSLRPLVDENTRLIAVSAIQFFSGHRTDLQAIGAFCRTHGIIFSVDVIQSAGHIPIDVQAMNISIMSASGHKSLMGPAGQGFLYVRRELAERMQPTFVGPNAVEDYQHWLKYKLTPKPAAQRFQMGTSNMSGAMGLLESVTMLREIGIPAIDAYTTALADYIIEQLRSLNYTVITPAKHGPIVTFRAAPTEEATVALYTALKERHIATAWHWDRHDVAHLRVSVHCYNTIDDIDRLINALEELNAK